jgi:hypothetical protein
MGSHSGTREPGFLVPHCVGHFAQRRPITSANTASVGTSYPAIGSLGFPAALSHCVSTTFHSQNPRSLTESVCVDSSWLVSLAFRNSKDQPPQSGSVDESALYVVATVPPNARAIRLKSRGRDSAEER